jgi:hypothetical protein
MENNFLHTPPSAPRLRFIWPWLALAAATLAVLAVLVILFLRLGHFLPFWGAATAPAARGILPQVPARLVGVVIWSFCTAVAMAGSLSIFAFALCLFLQAFRRPVHGLVATAILFVFGFTLYGCSSVVSPAPLRGAGDGWKTMARTVARFDNTISGFFPSRPNYSEIAHDAATDEAPANARPPLLPLSPLGLPPPYARPQLLAAPLLPSPPPSASPSPPPVHILLAFYLFHLLCYAYVTALAFSFFSRRIANAVLMLFSFIRHPSRRIRVFWGDGREAFAAAEAAAKCDSSDCLSVFVVPCRAPFALRKQPDPIADRLISESRLLWTYISPSKPIRPLGAFLSLASEHLFLGEDGRKNVIHAQQLLNTLANRSGRRPFLFFRPCLSPSIVVRIDSEAEDDALFLWADAKNTPPDPANSSLAPSVRVVREPTLVACDLLWNHPMHDVPGVSRSPVEGPSGIINVLLVGCGAHGKVLLRDLVQDAQLPGVSLHVTVVDRDSAAFSFLRDHAPDALRPSQICPFDIRFRRCDAFSSEFWSLMPARATPLAPPPPGRKSPPPLWNRIVLALDDDLANLRLALRIQRHYRANRLFDTLGSNGPSVVFARVRGLRNNDYVKALEVVTGSISVFGGLGTVYGTASFPGSPEENAAKQLNWIYHQNGKNDPPQSPETRWRATSSFHRESSRAAVFGFRNILWLLGYQACPAPSLAPSSAHAIDTAFLEKRLDALPAPIFRRLAETEHLRWNAFHLLRGFRPWTKKEYSSMLPSMAREIADTSPATGEAPDTRGVKENQLDTLRCHAAIAPFDLLPAIKRDFDAANEAAHLPRRSHIPDFDFDFIRNMPKILAAARWLILSPSP